MKAVAFDHFTLHVIRSPRGCLSYVVVSKEKNDAVVIDPSIEAIDEYQKIIPDVRLKFVVDTHTHADHISAYRELTRDTGALYVMHEHASSSHVDVRVRDGDTVQVGDVSLHVLYTPGHAYDAITLALEHVLFTADTLLIHGTGRTDLRHTASSAVLFDSIWGKIMTRSDATLIYPPRL